MLKASGVEQLLWRKVGYQNAKVRTVLVICVSRLILFLYMWFSKELPDVFSQASVAEDDNVRFWRPAMGRTHLEFDGERFIMYPRSSHVPVKGFAKEFVQVLKAIGDSIWNGDFARLQFDIL